MARSGEKVAFKFAVGDEVTETITGYKGIVTAQFHYLNGCRRYLLEGKIKPDGGGNPEGLIYDEDRLTKTKTANAKVPATGGGPASTSPPALNRSR